MPGHGPECVFEITVDIARCCAACNSSKGRKKLADWLQSSYCKKRGINEDTVAEVVKEALRVCI
jgi:hypothetical protein